LSKWVAGSSGIRTVEAEFAGYLAQFADLRTDAGHAAVVRNGHHPERPFQTGIGPVSVRIPKVRSKDGTPVTFRSALVPPYVRRTKTLEAALPWLYLKGISSGEMAPALKVLLGPDAKGLSANTVSRLKRDWAEEYEGWKVAAFDDEPIVYIWADGVHSGLRGEDDKLCALVIVGVICVFRGDTPTDSDLMRPAVPISSAHRFRWGGRPLRHRNVPR